jgi:hypothetical protein
VLLCGGLFLIYAFHPAFNLLFLSSSHNSNPLPLFFLG